MVLDVSCCVNVIKIIIQLTKFMTLMTTTTTTKTASGAALAVDQQTRMNSRLPAR